MRLTRDAVREAAPTLSKWLEYQRRLRRMPGLSAGIVFDREAVLSEGFGYADVERGFRATAATRYRIASISKLFTAIAVLRLAETGAIRLNDGIGEFLTPHPQTRWLDRVTVRDLLTHHSGVARDGATAHWANSRFPSTARMIRDVRRGPPVFAPRRKFKYSNLGFGLLGELVGVAANQSYETFVKREILEPLSMKSTTVDLPPDGKDLAIGYGRINLRQRRARFAHAATRAYAPATGFTSNVPDLCKLMVALMGGSKQGILSDASTRILWKLSYLKRSKKEGYGAGTQMWLVGGRRLLGHSGGFIGFSSRIAMDRQNRLGIVLLSNAQDSPMPSFLAATQSTIHFFSRNARRFSAQERVRNEPFLGRYSSRWSDFEFIDVRGHLLGFPLNSDEPTDGVLFLQPEGRDSFRISTADPYSHDGEKVHFVRRNKAHAIRAYIGPSPMRFVVDRPRERPGSIVGRARSSPG